MQPEEDQPALKANHQDSLCMFNKGDGGVRVIPGLEVFLEKGLFKNNRIGLVTNHTGINYDLKSNFDLMIKAGYKLAALFSPEHGIYGDHPDGQYVEGSTLAETKIPIYSLYGATQKPTREMLKNVDTLIFDIQDIGARYYTYMSTMILSMEAAAENGIEFLVLDRPNPIGGTNLEGNLPGHSWISPVSYAPVTIRHGMTAGEIAMYMAAEKGLARPEVVAMEGWYRDMYFDETSFPWVPTSPSAPTLEMAILYPGTCLFEGTNLSEGRGTSTPFQVTGAPWINGVKLSETLNGMGFPGVKMRPAHFRPSFGKWTGDICQGIQIHIFESRRVRPVELGVRLLFAIRDLYPDDFRVIPPGPNGKHFLDLLTGGTQLTKALERDNSPEPLLDLWNQDTEEFLEKRRNFLLYT